jgi:riboflavin synthase
MFTGIVTDIGSVRRAADDDVRFEVATAFDTAAIDMGASISCSGVCLTVVDKGPGWFAVDVSGETRARTAGEQWREGRRLNLERALRLGDELGGHIVTGHVDGVATVESAQDVPGSRELVLLVPADLAPFVAEKGSVTVDGVSLTVNEVVDVEGGTRVRLNIIPHTATVTTLGALAPGDAVNIEIDVLARYLQRMEAHRARR